MVNTQYLEEKIELSGKKRQYLADKIGCTRQTLTNKVKGKHEFNTKEIAILCSELNITTLSDKERIFFA